MQIHAHTCKTMENVNKVYIIYDSKGIMRGYCKTMQEADALCERHHEYTWDIVRRKSLKLKQLQNLPYMVATE